MIGQSVLGLSCVAIIFGCAPTKLCAAERHPIVAPVWTTAVCQPPKMLCPRVIKELAQGGILDFQATSDRATLRLLSPFAVERIEPLEKGRCPSRLCASELALSGLQEDLLKQGYYTQNIAMIPGGAVITLRTERIDGATKVLKGRCRFNLDPACSDSEAWLQEDQKSGEKCGFALTRLFAVTPVFPEFVEGASFSSAVPPHLGGEKSPNSVSIDTGSAKLFELLYVHKVCPSGMTLVRNG